MSKRKSIGVALFGAVWLIAGVGAQNRPPAKSAEQVEFSAEDEGVKAPARIPDEVWMLLKADEDVKSALEDENLTGDKPPRSLFSASVVHLHDGAERDLIVFGEEVMRGANIQPFWLFVETPKGPRLVAHGSAHDVRILLRRWKGYREIELMSATCCTVSTTILRFDGEKYVAYQKTSHNIN